MSVDDDGTSPFKWKFPAPHPAEKVNGDHPKPSDDARPRPRRIVIDPADWGKDASD